MLERAPPGVYIEFNDYKATHSEAELAAMRAQLPALPPAVIPQCPCPRTHTFATQMEEEGAIHGDRIRGRICLTGDDTGMCHPFRVLHMWSRHHTAQTSAHQRKPGMC